MEAIVAKKRGPKPNPDARRSETVLAKGRPEWKDWVQRLADFERISVGDLINRALADYGVKVGFPDPPPKR